MYVGNAPRDYELEPDQELSSFDDDKVRQQNTTEVPRHLLMKSEKELMMQDDEDIAEIETLVEDDDETTESFYVEAIIVIANGGILLKAEENPYMMGDRPIVAFPWDVVPDGSGVAVSVRKVTTAKRRLIQAAHVVMPYPLLCTQCLLWTLHGFLEGLGQKCAPARLY